MSVYWWSPRPASPPLVRYGFAVPAWLVALVLNLLVREEIGPNFFLPFGAAIFFTAWWGGLGPGLLATALSALATVAWFLPPFQSPAPEGFRTAVRLFTFVVVGTGMSALLSILRRAQQRAEALQQRYRQTAEALRESEARLRGVVDHVLDGLITTDQRGVVQLLNPAAERIFGYTAGEVVGRSVSMLMPEPFADEFDTYVRWYLLTGKSRVVGTGRDVVGRRKDGSTFPMDLAVSDVRLGDQRLFIGVFRDITERKRMEERLVRAERLEAAGRIAGQVAHDFNNLLAPMLVYPELIKMQLADDHPAVPFCDSIMEAAERMVAINDDLLALGRRGGFEQEPIDPNQLAEQLIADLTGLPEMLALELDLAPDLSPIAGSEAQLARVLANLVTNARDAMADAGRITIRTERVYLDAPLGRYQHVEPGEYVRLSVGDTGSGIPPEIRDRIFDAFFTTKRADKRRGTGLGLTIVQTVVEDHRGYVDVESAVGQGTTFSLYLPAYREAPQPLPAPVASSP